MMQKELESKLLRLRAILKEKNNELYNLKKREKLIRYSGEINSSMFELLSEIGILLSTLYQKHMLKHSIKRTEEEIHHKIPMIKEIEQEIGRIKKEHKRAFDLHGTQEDLDNDIDLFIKMRLLYEEMDALAFLHPHYKVMIDNFQSRLLDPDLTENEIKEYTIIEVEKVENQADRKVVLTLFEAVIGEVFKDSNPLEHEKNNPKNGEGRVDREHEVNTHRVIQRQR